MNSSVYISSEKIEVIGYSKAGSGISVKKYVTFPLEEGAMINGMIIDHAVVSDALSEMKGQNPELFSSVSLTVDGSSILLKRLVVPKLSGNQYYKLVTNELSDRNENARELVCDYEPMSAASKDKGSRRAILACAAEKSLIESYESVFKNAGIKLKAIRIGVQAILRYVNAVPSLRGSTFVLNVIDGFTMLSMIFENGTNVFMSRTRLYGEDNAELLRNIIENLSGMIQFNKSEKFGEITHSYYLGLSAEDMAVMSQLNHHAELKLAALDVFGGAGGDVKLEKDAHFVYFNALFDNTGTDLTRSLKKHDKLIKSRRPRARWPLAVLGLLAVVAVPTAYITHSYLSISNNIDSIEQYMKNENIVKKSKELDRIINETVVYADIASQEKSKRKEEGKTADVETRLLEMITSTLRDRVKVSRFEYDRSKGTIQVSAIGISENDSAMYINALGMSGEFESMHYTGYSFTNEGQYSFSISLTLAAGEEGK